MMPSDIFHHLTDTAHDHGEVEIIVYNRAILTHPSLDAPRAPGRTPRPAPVGGLVLESARVTQETYTTTSCAVNPFPAQDTGCAGAALLIYLPPLRPAT